MKRHTFKQLMLIAGITLLSACSDWLTIEPEGKIVLGDYWNTESDVEAVIATCYRSMIDYEYIRRLIIWGEMRSDNIVAGNGIKETEKRILEANITPANWYSSWSQFYTVINYCNAVLYYTPKVIDPNFTEAKMRAKMAEALALRALTYFYLVRTYKDIPLILEPSVTDQQDYSVPQSSENTVLDQIESDLLKAEEWAMTSFSSIAHTKGRITKNAVRALLADVYLWRNKYNQTVTYCDKIIESPAFKLIEADETPYMQIFSRKNSTESIFELQFGESFKINENIPDLYGSRDEPEGILSVPQLFCNTNTLFETTDVRRKDFIRDQPVNGLYYITKYAIDYRFENNTGVSTYLYRYTTPNWIIYRLTDVMLMKAEALVQLNRSEQDLRSALQLVNTTYMRSNPTLLNDTLDFETYNTKRAMEDLVLAERQRELMFEGKRWFDLVRLARREGNTDRLLELVLRKYTENQSVIKTKLKDLNSMYMPINENELKANKKLVQNPFYTTKQYN